MQHTFITRETLIQKVLDLSHQNSRENTISLPNSTIAGATTFSLALVKEASDACPAVPLRAVSAITLVLLETAQTAKVNKKNLLRLARDSLELANTILSHYYDPRTAEWRNDMPREHNEMIFRFVEQAYTIYLHATSLGTRPLIKRFFDAKMDVDIIEEFRETLNHARHIFQLGIILETSRNMHELRHSITLSPIQISTPVEPTIPPQEPTDVLTASITARPRSAPPHIRSQFLTVSPSSPSTTTPSPSTVCSSPPSTPENPLFAPFPSLPNTGTYLTIGGDYTTTAENTYNNTYNSEDVSNWEVKDSYNVTWE